MSRLTLSLVLATALAVPLGAQTQAGAAAAPAILPLSAIPHTPAGDALRGWLEAFNSGDSVRFEAFLKAHGSEQAGQAPMQFRRMTGGFDLIAIERSEPQRIEFGARERNGPTTAVGEIRLSAGQPPRMIG